MAEYINPQWRLPNKKTGNNNNYSMDFTMGTGVNFGSLSNILGNGIITYNTSYSVWIKPDFSYNTNTYQTFFGNFASGNNVLLLYYAHDINAFKFAVGDGSGHNFVSSQAFTSDQELGKGEWQHHCVSFDTVNNNAYYYIDNVQVNTSTGLSRKIATNQNFYIGKKWDLTSGGFTGEISQGCIFKYALPPTGSNSVAALWNGGNPGNPMALSSPPVAYYPLGNSAHMGSNYLTPNGALQDYVFDFPATDAVQSNFTLFNGASEACISAWFKTDVQQSGKCLFSTPFSSGGNKFDLYFQSAGFSSYLKTVTNISNIASSTINYYDNKWHNVIVTYDGVNHKIYYDGNEVATAARSGVLADSTYNKLEIGRFGTSFSNNVNAKISNVLAWTKGLSSSEATTLYNYGSPIQTLANIPQSSNLKAWYKLDATEIYNSSSTEWEVNNALSPWTSSLNFNGSSDYINYGSPSSLDFERTDAFSISAWVKRVGSGFYQSIIYKAINGSPYNGYTFYIDNNNKVGFNITIDYTSNNYFGKVCTSVLNTDWNNVLITYNGNSNVSGVNIYINGSLQTVTTVGTSSDLTGTLSNSIPFNIGARNNTDVFLDGKLSNTQVFNTALPETGSNSVETIYNNGAPLTDMSSFSSLVSWWKLDNTTTGIEDSKGSNNGTNNGATEAPGSVSTLNGESTGMSQTNLVQSDLLTTSSYSPYALSFDGNDHIDCGATVQQPTTNYSVSCWVKFDTVVGNIGIVGNFKNGVVPQVGFALTLSSGFNFQFWADGTASSNAGTVTGTSTPNVDTWYNVLGTYDGSVVKIYVNNVLENSVSYSATPGATDQNLVIGRWYGNYSDYYTTGSISNVSVWNVALTASQIREVYNEGRPSNLHNFSGTAPVAWWQLGSNSSFASGWTVLDEIGSSDGTSNSMLENAIVDGVGTSSNGVSTGMGLANNISGSSPSGEGNSLSVNMTLANIAGGVN